MCNDEDKKNCKIKITKIKNKIIRRYKNKKKKDKPKQKIKQKYNEILQFK